MWTSSFPVTQQRGGMWLYCDQSIIPSFLCEMSYYLFVCYLFWFLEQKPHHNNPIILVLHNFQTAFTCISSYDSYIAVKETELVSSSYHRMLSTRLCLLPHTIVTVKRTFISTWLTILHIPQGQMLSYPNVQINTILQCDCLELTEREKFLNLLYHCASPL